MAALFLPTAQDVQDIVAKVAENPSIVLTDPETANAFFAATEAEAKVDAEKHNPKSAKGRDSIKALAYSITRTKTAIDNAGKVLTEEWRRKTGEVNERRRIEKERFEALSDSIRLPVTQYENAEKVRIEEGDAIIARIKAAGLVAVDENSSDVQVRLDDIRGINLNDELFGQRIELVTDLRDETVSTLSAAVERLRQAEADKAELERLRREQAERQAQEEAQRRQQQAAEAEARRKQEEEDRIRHAEKQAAEKAARDAAEKAQIEAQKAIDEANARAAKAEREAAAERARLEREEAARIKQADTERREREAREANANHRKAVMLSIITGLQENANLDRIAAERVVEAVISRKIPALSIAF